MIDEKPLSDRKLHRERALQVVDAAEKAVLMANGRCDADTREELRMAERFLGIARRRFILEDWDEARLFGRLAGEHAERATRGAGTAPSAPDQDDAS